MAILVSTNMAVLQVIILALFLVYKSNISFISLISIITFYSYGLNNDAPRERCIMMIKISDSGND